MAMDIGGSLSGRRMRAMDQGEVIGGVVNSMSRLMHLVSCHTTTGRNSQALRSTVAILKQLKPVLDEALNLNLANASSHLTLALEDLDAAVNQSREHLEMWHHKMPKIYTVLQSRSMLFNVHRSSMRICEILNEVLLLSSSTLSLANIQCCIQELHCVEVDPCSDIIEKTLQDIKEKCSPRLEDITKIVNSLGLASNLELLEESIALEKERLKLEVKNGDAELINWLIVFIDHVKYCIQELKQYRYINGIPIPSHFRCPLSLQFMQDPVIVASGQTYERSFIQKWFNNGLTICPKTRQNLVHIDLIPNYTVKALIETWCHANNLKIGKSICHERGNKSFPTNCLEVVQPGNALDYFPQRESAQNHSAEYSNQPKEREHETPSVCGEDPYLVSDPHSTSVCESKSSSKESLEQRSSHSQSESISSVISSISLSSRFEEKVSLEVSYPPSSPLKDLRHSPAFSPNQFCGSNSGQEYILASQSMHLTCAFDNTTASPHVQGLIEDLKSQAPEIQTAAASKLRLLARHNMESRVLIARCGAIPPLVALLDSPVKVVQENAVTALLNLSINNHNKFLIAEAGALEYLIHVLGCGSPEARENSAATLYSLSILEEYRGKIGCSGAIKALVDLLEAGTLQGRKDAVAALFNLSIFHENKARIVRAGAVKFLAGLMEPSTGMGDKAVALLSNLSTVAEGRTAIAQEGGIPLLVEVVETGSHRGMENAASALLQLCLHSSKLCSLVLQEGAVPPLIALSKFGTPRAKEKAQQLLSHFRSQREGVVRRAKQ